MAPVNFGPLPNKLLLGTVHDGKIVAFDSQTRSATEYGVFLAS